MVEHREIVPDLALPHEVQVRRNAADAARQAAQDTPPAVDDQRIAVRLATVLVETRLRRRDDVHEILDRARAQQHLPVCATGRPCERGRQADPVRAAATELAKELRKTDVIADRETEASGR